MSEVAIVNQLEMKGERVVDFGRFFFYENRVRDKRADLGALLCLVR
jgi:hypothetical protein